MWFWPEKTEWVDCMIFVRLLEKSSHKSPRVWVPLTKKSCFCRCVKSWKDTKISYRKCSLQIPPPATPRSVRTSFDHESAGKKLGKTNGEGSEGVEGFTAKTFSSGYEYLYYSFSTTVLIGSAVSVRWKEVWELQCRFQTLFEAVSSKLCSKLNIYLTHSWLVEVVALAARLRATLLATMCYC